MSEYQYYEFCRIHTPLSSTERKVMSDLSSRARVGTHGAAYVYNYSDFPGNISELLLKHFDLFLYMSNLGCLELILKYPIGVIDQVALESYCLPDVITYERHKTGILLSIEISDEEAGGGWIEGEGMLPALLPLHQEIQSGNYGLLTAVAQMHAAPEKSLPRTTSSAQNAFISAAEEMRGLI